MNMNIISYFTKLYNTAYAAVNHNVKYISNNNHFMHVYLDFYHESEFRQFFIQIRFAATYLY